MAWHSWALRNPTGPTESLLRGGPWGLTFTRVPHLCLIYTLVFKFYFLRNNYLAEIHYTTGYVDMFSHKILQIALELNYVTLTTGRVAFMKHHLILSFDIIWENQ
jgi:hypothetical protein